MMMRSSSCAVLTLLLCMLLTPAPAANAQETPSADGAVDINEGIYYYLSGLRDVRGRGEEEFLEAIKRFSSALEQAPKNKVALLFRALAYGQTGLSRHRDAVPIKTAIKTREDAFLFLNDPSIRKGLEDDLAMIENGLLDESIPSVERVELLMRKNTIETRLDNVDQLGAPDVIRFEQEQALSREQIHAAAAREREAYAQMVADIKTLLGELDRPEAMVRLLDVVAKTAISSLLKDEAVRGRRREVAPQALSAPPAVLLKEKDRMLADVARNLRSILENDPPTGGVLARTRFFLGVILYRQGVPLTEDNGGPRPKNRSLLNQAEAAMLEVAQDPDVEATWRSYAALYLGLIVPFRAVDAKTIADRSDLLDEAAAWLKTAAELDVRERPGQAPESVTNFIPVMRYEQLALIDKIRTAPRVARIPIDDLSLTFYSGVHRDTNVILLGGRTDLPRGISREKDFGFSTGVVAGYTKELTDRWTLGVEGRASALWHADIDEFDEQDYGGSVALQYELIEKRDDFGPVHIRLQYDYDYTLLGRQGFLSSNRLTPNVRVFWDDRRAETNLFLTFDVRDYFEQLADARTDRTGEYFAIGVTQSFKCLDMADVYTRWGLEPWGHARDASKEQEDPDYPKRYFTPFVGFQYGWDQTAGTEFDQKSYLLLVGATIPLPWGVDLRASTDFEWQDYQRGSVIDFHRRARRDFIQRYRVEFSRVFVLREGQMENRYRPNLDRVTMTLRAHAAFTHNDSNVVDRLGQAIFEYDRTLYGISLAFTIN